MNDAMADAPATLENPVLSPLIARWRDTPDRLIGAFHDGDEFREVDTATFMARALQFSALLAQAGTSPGEIVVIILDHGIDAHAAFIGAMLIGGVPAFMPSPNIKQDSALYWRQHREVFAHTMPGAILVSDPLRDAVAEAAAATGAVVLAVSAVEALAPATLGPLPEPDAVALLQHSSGTTGLKKGVKLTYRAITDQFEAYAQALNLDAVAAPRFATWLPLYHDMGLISSFLLPIWRGVPIISIDPFEWTADPSLWLDAIERYGATHAWVPNFALLHQVRSARGGKTWKLDTLVAIIGCSEPNKPEAFDAFADRFAESGISPATLQACYAMAETVFAVSQSRIGEKVRRLTVDREAWLRRGAIEAPAPEAEQAVLLSNGRPVPGCAVRILKDDAFVAERIIGEVCVNAPYMFSGYHNNPAASGTAFFGEWLRTGDLGFLDQGEVFIVGRLKDVIIVNGKNVFAHDVEAAVSRVPNVKPGRAVAFGFYAETVGSEQLVVVAERSGPDPAGDAELIRSINHAVIGEVGLNCGDIRVVAPGWLVKTTSGKMSRSENTRKYAEFLAGGGGR
jgi:acyl-CoA synthetase (AMP-forming)/AMP-acid ligase II